MFPIRKTLKAFLQAKQNIELNRQLAQIKRQDWGEVACVFQPGKSGSTSALDALLRSNYKYPVCHLHSFKDGVDTWNPTVKLEFLRRLRKGFGGRVKLIIPIREPISRNKSSFLQHVERHKRQPWDGIDFSVEEYWQMYLKSEKRFWLLNWFDNELKPHFGIDVYAQPFAGDHGVYTHKNVEALIYHHDIPDDKKSRLLCDFLKTSDITVSRSNVTASKKSSLPENLQLKPTREYIEEMLHSKYASHFFKEKIAEISNKYQKNN